MPPSLSACPGKNDSRAPISESLLTLAPSHLPNHRQVRYLGDDLCVSCAELAGHDQKLLRNLFTNPDAA